ncbi:MAG: NAD(P)/FAD-dependent oxidoreductase [Deltaproteobacteria bacterium]|nr:NAD(P)/FAD-dependent oxidoreductase [Deltaproteobacteria bacterium]
MKPTDRNLGMDRPISRRDLLHGMGTLAASTLLPGRALAEEMLALERAGETPAGYPPARTGLRGNHVGSFETALDLAFNGRRDWGAVEEPDPDVYDLVVVGGGLSGLAAAHFYRKQHPKARILILDNHDDFGGHAKRNEFQIGSRTLIGYGGSQTLQEPSYYPDVVKGLLRDLGVDKKRFDTAYDQGFFKRNGLRGGIHFNREKWGVDRMVPYELGILKDYVPVAPSRLSPKEAVEQMPISEPARREFLRLLVTDQNQMSEIPLDARAKYLFTLSYRDFLIKHLDIHEPEVFAVLEDLASDSGVGIEAVPAGSALYYTNLPGWGATGLPDSEETEPYIHHFPDGNASIARLLVREMIPAVARGKTMDDVVTARFDYSKLDEAKSPVRLRLNSTAVRVEHDGDPKSAKRVRISYVRGGHAYRVQARSCVLACYNMMIPHLCPELPAPQREALALQVKTPILYTNVALRNWQAWKKLGIGAVIAPGSFHINAMLDFPVSLGGYQYSKGPDDPIVVHMERFPHRSNMGLSPRDQHRLGRYEMLSTSFETLERNVRSQLTGMLSAGGFDPARDIEGITVNRWAHGYAYWYNPLFDTYYQDRDDERYPHMQARKRFGRIAIANSDAGARAMLESAVEQGHRAATELS